MMHSINPEITVLRNSNYKRMHLHAVNILGNVPKCAFFNVAGISILFLTYFMSIIPKKFPRDLSDFTRVHLFFTMDVHINNLNNIIKYSSFSSHGCPLLVKFMSITHVILALRTPNFTHISIYVKCISTQIISAVLQVFLYLDLDLDLFI